MRAPPHCPCLSTIFKWDFSLLIFSDPANKFNIFHPPFSVLVIQSCLTLCNSMDCSQPASSVHGILQARILDWVTISISRGSSWPRGLLLCRQIHYHLSLPSVSPTLQVYWKFFYFLLCDVRTDKTRTCYLLCIWLHVALVLAPNLVNHTKRGSTVCFYFLNKQFNKKSWNWWNSEVFCAHWGFLEFSCFSFIQYLCDIVIYKKYIPGNSAD